MSGTLRFRWDSNRARDRVRHASVETLEELREDAHGWWLLMVPVKTGRLRDSWFSVVHDNGENVMLLIGAGDPPVPYILYVELGTGIMPPRAPIRTTAGEVAPLVLPKLAQKLKAA